MACFSTTFTLWPMNFANHKFLVTGFQRTKCENDAVTERGGNRSGGSEKEVGEG